jgi:PilZ domain
LEGCDESLERRSWDAGHPFSANLRKVSVEVLRMQLGPHRARRYSFHAAAELTDLQSETQTKEQTSNLSLFGCHVGALKPLPPGTKVRIKITHRNESFEALGKVTFAQQNAGMGIFFTKIESRDQSVLDRWIAELRGQSDRQSDGR